jgi:hypothetical protein
MATRTTTTRRRKPAAKNRALSALFDVTTTKRPSDGRVEYVPLGQIELARNPRRDISADGIDRLAEMLARTGQLVPAIGRRADDTTVLLYAGQRRLLAAQRSAELAAQDGYEDLRPVVCLMVLLVDYEPTDGDIRRIQAQENSREDLTIRDKQQQFADCWAERTGMVEEDRMVSVCADLGISAKLGCNLRRQLTLPDVIRERVSERPAGGQISITLANKLSEMHEIAPELTGAVAERVSSSDLHDRALRDLGAFVQRTVVENEQVYAIRIDEGMLLDCHEQLDRARAHLKPSDRAVIASAMACEERELTKELDALQARAKAGAVKLRVDGALRERASNGRYAWTFERGTDFAAGVWVIDPAFVIEAIHETIGESELTGAVEETYFGAAKLSDDDIRAAAAEDKQRKQAEREQRAQAISSNLGLGEDIRAGLLEPRGEQLDALRKLVCHLLVNHYPEVIAYGAGWSDRERQQPVNEGRHFEPLAIDATVAAELQRALDDPDPLRGIMQLTVRFAAAFVLDPTGVMRTKALGTERIGRRLQQALPGGENPVRQAVWELIRPMLSPRLVELNKDAFVRDEAFEQTADLQAHRSESALSDLDLGEDAAEASDA